MDNIKCNKLSSVLYKEIAEIINEDMKNNFHYTKLLITLIKISMDSYKNSMKVYINIYPFFNEKVMYFLRSRSSFYKKSLTKRLRYRIKKIPNLFFCYFSK
ncbi:ribosome-binding factor A [Blattabacterium cuenoti]|uniref:ribosome-binding factor A n=1 Tax=Blattabacterium cuenoti TaxID=1653831 RepID=UPI00163C3A73|nr:ribosome-binding factor A [Blattabacterium cuenoti]